MDEIKLVEEHKVLIDGLSKELKQHTNQTIYDVIELGFIVLRLGTEGNEAIIKMTDELRNDKEFMERANLMRKWWNAG